MSDKHKYPVGALVEMVFTKDELELYPDAINISKEPKLFVVYHSFDCDGSPLYCVCADKNNTALKKGGSFPTDWYCGWGEESLKLIEKENK